MLAIAVHNIENHFETYEMLDFCIVYCILFILCHDLFLTADKFRLRIYL